jgi:HAD superfamily hydrolase (TIGR01509 family)
MPIQRNSSAIIRRKHWIFDLDGTLTIAVHDFKSIKEALGVPAEADILSHLDSLPAEESAQRHKKLDNIERVLSEQAVAASGARELLSLLIQDNCKIGILTRNTHEVARLTLKYAGLGEYFTEPAFIIGRRDAAPKPDPEGALQLASLWGATPGEIIVTGDYLYDLLCGKNLGSATVHVDPTGEFRWSEFADVQVTSLLQLVEMRASV